MHERGIKKATDHIWFKAMVSSQIHGHNNFTTLMRTNTNKHWRRNMSWTCLLLAREYSTHSTQKIEIMYPIFCLRGNMCYLLPQNVWVKIISNASSSTIIPKRIIWTKTYVLDFNPDMIFTIVFFSC